jgi:hypothetical protein
MLSEWQVFKANSKNWMGGYEIGSVTASGLAPGERRNLKRRGEA